MCLQQISEYVSSLNCNSMKPRAPCVQADDDKPKTKAVIGKTFKAQHYVSPISLLPSGPFRLNHFQMQIKTKDGK